MKALVTGAGGQLGVALLASAPAGWAAVGLTRAELDIGDLAAARATLRAHAPDLVLNAAAYTAVDRAENESEAAHRINRDGARFVAEAAKEVGARLVHVSTDFVFDGRAGRPWRPDDPTGPLNVYGASKLAGEAAVAIAAPEALIVRTGWVYGPLGANFLATMLRLMNSRPELRVIADQIGTPTSTLDLATALWSLGRTQASGILHYANAGAASWYDFAVAIAEEAVAAGLLEQAPPIIPIATSDYPTPAARPTFSVLDKTAAYALLGGPAPHWRAALRAVLTKMKT